jgi:hypothetical protein
LSRAAPWERRHSPAWAHAQTIGQASKV